MDTTITIDSDLVAETASMAQAATTANDCAWRNAKADEASRHLSRVEPRQVPAMSVARLIITNDPSKREYCDDQANSDCAQKHRVASVFPNSKVAGGLIGLCDGRMMLIVRLDGVAGSEKWQ